MKTYRVSWKNQPGERNGFFVEVDQETPEDASWYVATTLGTPRDCPPDLVNVVEVSEEAPLTLATMGPNEPLPRRKG